MKKYREQFRDIFPQPKSNLIKLFSMGLEYWLKMHEGRTVKGLKGHAIGNKKPTSSENEEQIGPNGEPLQNLYIKWNQQLDGFHHQIS